MNRQALKKITVFTIGHSTHPLGEFIDILNAHRIALVVDIRTIPRSRHNPQFAQETLPPELRKAGIEYRHLKGLGGLRRPRTDSPNSGWRSAAFRGFADYMQTEDFREALEELIGIAGTHCSAIMCAEAVPWRCHRSLIADALLIRGIQVEHITGKIHSQPHKLTPFAAVDGLKITYPQEDSNQE